jgi:hypothetical protein
MTSHGNNKSTSEHSNPITQAKLALKGAIDRESEETAGREALAKRLADAKQFKANSSAEEHVPKVWVPRAEYTAANVELKEQESENPKDT